MARKINVKLIVHIRDDAPDELKVEFKEFFDNVEGHNCFFSWYS